MLKRRKKQIADAAAFFAVCAVVFAVLLILRGRSQSDGMPPLTVTLLKVGRADAIIVRESSATLVIDTGEEDDGEELVEFLTSQGISRVDTLIITHFDKDHVGGGDTLVESVETGRVLLPDYDNASTEYLDFLDSLDRRGIVPERLSEPLEFTLGEATVLVEPPASYDIPDDPNTDYDNNLSLITTVTYGNNRFLFTGDSEKQRIREWLADGNVQTCDFLKVPHHGVYNTALQELLQSVRPKYAAICSSKKNPAESRTLELLGVYGAEALETRNGNVIVTSNGDRLKVSQIQDY